MTLDLLPLGATAFHLVYLVCFWNASLENRGWPLWMPKWVPNPFDVLFFLPVLGIACAAASWLILWKRRDNQERPLPKDFLRLTGVASGATAVVLVHNLVFFPHWFVMWLD
jgi:hypothetical protein